MNENEQTEALIKRPIRMARSDRENLVPIVGAGVSISLGLPNWNQLIQNLSRGANISLEDSSLEGDPPDVLQEIKRRMGETAFIKSIQQELQLPRTFTSTTLQALVTAPIRRIITTNLDFAIETAFTKAGKPLPPENIARGYSPEELSMFDYHSDAPILLKIHGSLERPSTWVLTREDYDKAYVQPGWLKEFFSAKVPIPLFIGFSFSDFYIRKTLQLAKLFWGKRAYTIIKIDEAKKHKNSFMDIGVIPIAFYSYDQIPEIIDEIFQCSPLTIERCSYHLKSRLRIRIGGAEIEVPQNFQQEKLDRAIDVLANAFEVQPPASIIDGRERRLYGPKGSYRDKIIKILNEREESLLQMILKAMVQYPELLFDSLTPSILKREDINHFMFFKVFFDSVSQDSAESKRMEFVLLDNLHNPNIGYKCLRAVANILALRRVHPAMRIPPVTVQVGTLLVSRYPLTRYQVGLLTNDYSLRDNHPVRPYTLQSKREIQKIIKKLRAATNQQWRLPSAKEWLMFAGIQENPWPWGKDDPKFKEHAHLKYIDQGGSIAQHPLEVGIFPKGKSKHGLFDLIGNVYEVVTTGSGYALAGGAWTTAFKSRDRFQMISGWAAGRNNVGIRPVLDANSS